MKEKYLPIGTVCRLQGGVKPLMIIGFCVPNPNDKDMVMDYNGCLYPEGVISSDMNFLFNHNDIEEIIYDGLVNDAEREFKVRLKELMEHGTVDGKPVDLNSMDAGFKPNNHVENNTPEMFNNPNNN